MKRSTLLPIAIATVVVALGGAALYAQAKGDKYALKSAGGVAFSDWYKNCRTWAGSRETSPFTAPRNEIRRWNST